MDFFNHIFLDNSVKNYCIVAGTILLTLLLKKYLSRYIASFLCRLVKRVWKNVHKPVFVDLVVEPLGWFLVILIAVFSIDKLNFPSAFHYRIYGHTTDDIVTRVGAGLIIVFFIWLVLRLVDFVATVLEEKANLTEDTKDNQLIVFFRDFFKVIIGIIGILLIVKACFNQPIGNLLTGLSIFGAALAFAAKESLENLIASFIIFFDKPFFVGDTVKVNTVNGTIEKIGLRSTRIRTADKTLVSVPNKQMVDTVVDNWSMRTERRAEIKLELSVKTSLATTEQLIAAFKKVLETAGEQIYSYTVLCKELNKNGVLIVVEYFTVPFSVNEADLLKEKINFSIKKILEEKEVEFAGEANTIVFSSESR